MKYLRKIMLSTVDLINSFFLLLLETFFPRDFDHKELEERIVKEIEDLKYKKYSSCNYFLNYKDELVRNAIWEMKFKNNRHISKIFAQLVCVFLKDKDDFILIPIPIHKKRRAERGFNQCEWICEDIIKILKEVNYQPKILIRNKYTEKQSWSTDKEARLEKLKGCFVVNEKLKDIIIGKKIVLIDDVVTTGSTIKEARPPPPASLVILVVIAH
jgi:ComF family protein